jgi:hypothetical protein
MPSRNSTPTPNGQEVSDTSRHQVEPALIEMPMIALTRAEVARPRYRILTIVLVSEAHQTHSGDYADPRTGSFEGLFFDFFHLFYSSKRLKQFVFLFNKFEL